MSDRDPRYGSNLRRRVLRLALATLASLVLATEASPSGFGDLLRQDRLTGSWSGNRPELEERGLTFEAFYTFEVLGNLSGGVHRKTETLGNLDLQLTAELEPLVGWSGGRVFFYGLGNHGGRPSENVGDLQIVSNIEAPDTWKLYEAWFEQEFLRQRLSMRIGLYDFNSEFDVIESAGVFLNSSHGIGAELGGSGRNGPSIFPTTSLSARLHLQPTKRTFVRLVAADGVPGDLDDPGGTEIRFGRDDGVFLAGEIGVYNSGSKALAPRDRRPREDGTPTRPSPEPSGKLALGAWGYTGRFDDLLRTDGSGNPRKRSGSFGVYLLAEQRVHFEPEDPIQGLSLYARMGIADPRTTTVDGYLGAGAVYRGVFPGSRNDRLGLAVAAAHLGSDFRRARRRMGTSSDAWEITIEWTYRVELTPWLAVQPDAQYVINPGGLSDLEDAFVLGMRLIVSL